MKKRERDGPVLTEGKRSACPEPGAREGGKSHLSSKESCLWTQRKKGEKGNGLTGRFLRPPGEVQGEKKTTKGYGKKAYHLPHCTVSFLLGLLLRFASSSARKDQRPKRCKGMHVENGLARGKSEALADRKGGGGKPEGASRE